MTAFFVAEMMFSMFALGSVIEYFRWGACQGTFFSLESNFNSRCTAHLCRQECFRLCCDGPFGCWFVCGFEFECVSCTPTASSLQTVATSQGSATACGES